VFIEYTAKIFVVVITEHCNLRQR